MGNHRAWHVDSTYDTRNPAPRNVKGAASVSAGQAIQPLRLRAFVDISDYRVVRVPILLDASGSRQADDS